LSIVYLMAILYQRNRYRTIVLCGNICENLGPPFIPTLHFVQGGDFPAGKLNMAKEASRTVFDRLRRQVD
jgi:hypothetical protein